VGRLNVECTLAVQSVIGNHLCRLTMVRYRWFPSPSTDISFENEEQLRDRGTARTPDVLLSVPLGIEVLKKDSSGTEWKIICWIDSKVRKRGVERKEVIV